MDKKDIPYIVYESTIVTMERTIKRLWILCIIFIVLLIGTNTAWLKYETQFQDVITTTYTTDTSNGGNAIINESGEVNINGKSDQNSNKNT